MPFKASVLKKMHSTAAAEVYGSIGPPLFFGLASWTGEAFSPDVAT